MVDETQGVPPSDNADEPLVEQKPNRSLWGVVGILVTAIVVIIILLMLPRCGSSGDGSSGQNTGKTIVEVRPYEPTAGSVSVWVDDSTEIGAALSAAGVRSVAQIDMGGGRWVVAVSAGTEDRAVAALKATSGVHDAGRVYEGDR